MRRSFSAGLVVLLPLALSLWLLIYLFDLVTNPLYHLITFLVTWYNAKSGLIPLHHHHVLVQAVSRIGALVVTFALITALGFVARKLFFHAFVRNVNAIIFKIPIVGTIYRLTKDITKGLLSSDQKPFQETVLVPFPSPHTHALGLITGSAPAVFKAKIPTLDVSVFVPTAPHPISGYVLLASESSLEKVPISVEETFKFLISCGIVPPSSTTV